MLAQTNAATFHVFSSKGDFSRAPNDKDIMKHIHLSHLGALALRCSLVLAAILTVAASAAAADAKKPPIRDLWKQPDLTPAQRQALAKTICLDNLKKLGAAAKRYGDTNGVLPANWPAIRAYLPSPEFLVCVSDTNKVPAAAWRDLKAANQSYELLSPNVRKPGPNQIVARCSLHGHIVLAGGQAFQGDYLEKNKLKVVDNKLQ